MASPIPAPMPECYQPDAVAPCKIPLYKPPLVMLLGLRESSFFFLYQSYLSPLPFPCVYHSGPEYLTAVCSLGYAEWKSPLFGSSKSSYLLLHLSPCLISAAQVSTGREASAISFDLTKCSQCPGNLPCSSSFQWWAAAFVSDKPDLEKKSIEPNLDDAHRICNIPQASGLLRSVP